MTVLDQVASRSARARYPYSVTITGNAGGRDRGMLWLLGWQQPA